MSRGVKVLTEMKEEEIVLLKDVDVKFVSLVRHGANQSPFRVIKSDGGKDMPKVIQAIILPDGVTLSSLAEKDELAWLNDAKQDKVEKFDEYLKLEQLSEDQFVDGSLQLVKIDPRGSYVMVGEAKDNEVVKTALTLGEHKEKALDIPTSPMNEPIAEREGPAFVLTFRDMFEKELSSFLDVVKGAMSQSQSDVKKRKAAVMHALDSFKSFLAIGMDELSKSGKKSKKEDVTAIDQVVERILTAINEKQGGSDMLFKSQEEFDAAVGKLLDEKLKAVKAGGMNTDPDAHGEKIKGKNSLGTGGYTIKNLETGEEMVIQIDDDGQITEIKTMEEHNKNKEKDGDVSDANKDTSGKETVEKIERLTNRIEELEGSLAGDPAGSSADDETGGNGADKDSPFVGMFTKGHASGGLNRFLG